MTGGVSLVGEFTVEYTVEETGEHRRVTFQHLAGSRWLRAEARETPTGWSGVGQEIVRDVETSPVDQRRD